MEKFRSIAEAVLILGLIIVGGIALEKETAYKCEARNLAMNCDSLSQYYGIPNGKCINSEIGNKLCKSGWELLSSEIDIKSSSKVKVNANGGDYSCQIENEKIESYTKCIKENGQEAYLGELV